MDYLSKTIFEIARGSFTTLAIFSFTLVISVFLGVIVALGRLSNNKIIETVVKLYVWIFRGTPLLLQLFFIYYGLPLFGIKFSSFTCAILGFSINYAAYFSEIFRAGIQSIDKGQYEAAKVLGMSYYQTMKRIILPQTLKRVLPPVCNETINLIKDTALVISIAMQDLLRAAKEIVTRDFTILPFIVAAGMYLVFTTILSGLFHYLEKKFSYYQ